NGADRCVPATQRRALRCASLSGLRLRALQPYRRRRRFRSRARAAGRSTALGQAAWWGGVPMTFLEDLRTRWREGRTWLCVGLDPELERLPATVREGHDDEEALVAFTTAIVDATADLACAFKPNVAFYEAYGPAGMRALIRIIAHIHKHHLGVPVLLDAK